MEIPPLPSKLRMITYSSLQTVTFFLLLHAAMYCIMNIYSVTDNSRAIASDSSLAS